MPDRFSFDDDRDGVGSHGAVELVALVEQGRLAGVQVLRDVVACVGVASADEAEDSSGGVSDGEDEAIAELVDQAVGAASLDGNAGNRHLVVRHTVSA